MIEMARGSASATKTSDQPRLGEIKYRRTFGISRFEADELIDNSGVPADLNEVWARIGDRYGFVWTTVREIAGGDVARDDPWLITAEVEDVLPDHDDDDGPEHPMGWLIGARWSTMDIAFLSIAVGYAIVGHWGWGLILGFAWLVICAIIDPETGVELPWSRTDD